MHWLLRWQCKWCLYLPSHAIDCVRAEAKTQRMCTWIWANATNAISKSMCATRDRFQWSLHCWLWTSWELCVRPCWIRWTQTSNMAQRMMRRLRDCEQGKIKRNEAVTIFAQIYCCHVLLVLRTSGRESFLISSIHSRSIGLWKTGHSLWLRRAEWYAAEK